MAGVFSNQNKNNQRKSGSVFKNYKPSNKTEGFVSAEPNKPNLAELNRVTDEEMQQYKDYTPKRKFEPSSLLKSPLSKDDRADIKEGLRRNFKPTETEKKQNIEEMKKDKSTAFALGLADGATLGLNSKLLQVATNNKEGVKDLEESAKRNNKIAYTTGELAGSIAPWAAAEGLVKKAGGKVINKIGSELGKRIAIGSTAGVLTEGAQSAIEGNNAKNVVTDALVGGAMGGSGEVLGATLGKVGKVIIDKLKTKKPLTAAEKEIVKNTPDLQKAVEEIKPTSQNTQVKFTTFREKTNIKPKGEPLSQVKVITKREPINIKPKGEQIQQSKVVTAPNGKKISQVSLITPKGNTIKASKQVGEPLIQKKLLTPKGETTVASKQIGEAKVSISKPMKGRSLKTEELTKNIAKRAATWKDKPKISYGRETLERNLEDIAGKDAPFVKKTIVEPIKKNEADRIRFLKKERKEIASFGIKARSKESELVQKYGEGFYIDKEGKKIDYTLENLKRDMPNKWENIVKATDAFRSKYDKYLDEINKALIRNGYDPILKRKDYFRHFEEVSGFLEKFGIPVKENKLPTDINGLTADFKPGKNFFASALQRKGPKTTYDAIQGIDKYIEGASKLMYHTDNIQRLRSLDKSIRDTYQGTDHLSNFVSDLTEYTNNLAGKKSMVDRAAENVVGRTIYGVADWARKRVGANLIGGNLSSALTNFIPLTQSIATTRKDAFIEGILDTLANVVKKDGFIEKSDYLTRRFGSDSLSMKPIEKVADKASILFKTVDSFVSQVIVRGKYVEGLKKGLTEQEALKQADDWAGRIMADRSLGSTPTLFNSKTLGILTQFQLEVNNQLSFLMKDIPRTFNKARAASAITQLFVYGYLFNNLFEMATGRRPALDPIGIALNAYKNYNNPEINKNEANKMLIESVAQQLPFTDLLGFGGGRIPITNAVPDLKKLATGETNLSKELIKTGTTLVSPFGGGQAKKTIEGLGVFNKEIPGKYKDLSDGKQLVYPIAPSIGNKIKAGVFGQYSVPEAREYYNNTRTPLSAKQTKVVEDANKKGIDPAKTYDVLLELREFTKKADEIKAINKRTDLTKEQKELLIKLIYAREKK